MVHLQTTIGSRIESGRNQLGYSAAQLAGRIGVQNRTLDNWEKDRSEPRVEKLTKLAGVLQVPLMWLLSGITPDGFRSKIDFSETAKIAQKLECAIQMQQNLAALLGEVSVDVARLQQQLDDEQDLAA